MKAPALHFSLIAKAASWILPQGKRILSKPDAPKNREYPEQEQRQTDLSFGKNRFRASEQNPLCRWLC
ncbi:MAG: hypothetical protein LBG98_00845 [Puniceicoccales bacterium]|nr:hypothetical protein [Puniceicoccales bacterium]